MESHSLLGRLKGNLKWAGDLRDWDRLASHELGERDCSGLFLGGVWILVALSTAGWEVDGNAHVDHGILSGLLVGCKTAGQNKYEN